MVRIARTVSISSVIAVGFITIPVGADTLPQTAATVAKVEAYVGAWGGYASKTTAIGGKVDLASAFLKITVQKNALGGITLQTDPWNAKATLRFDKASSRYFLSWTADGFPPVSDLPVAFVEAPGFSGKFATKCNDKDCEAEATVKAGEGGGSEWLLVITQGKDRWSLRLRLGKESATEAW